MVVVNTINKQAKAFANGELSTEQKRQLCGVLGGRFLVNARSVVGVGAHSIVFACEVRGVADGLFKALPRTSTAPMVFLWSQSCSERPTKCERKPTSCNRSANSSVQ